jgi:hypothetical protein
MQFRQGRTTGDPPSRAERRFAVSLAASVVTERGSLAVRLLDLSVGGALAESALAPAVGIRLILRRERIEVAARVIWKRGARFGLAFERPIRATELFFQLSRSRDGQQEPAPPLAPAAAA